MFPSKTQWMDLQERKTKKTLPDARLDSISCYNLIQTNFRSFLLPCTSQVVEKAAGKKYIYAEFMVLEKA